MWCTSVRHIGALAKHRRTCIGNKRPRIDHNIASSSGKVGTIQFDEHIETNEPIEVQWPNEYGQSSEPFLFNVLDDVLDDEMHNSSKHEASRYFYDSTFNLVNCIRTLKREEVLSDNAINRLFREVLLHPSFNVKGLSMKLEYDVEKHKRSLYNDADGWKMVQIDGSPLQYQDPIIALESLFSSSVIAENFKMTPDNEVVNTSLTQY